MPILSGIIASAGGGIVNVIRRALGTFSTSGTTIPYAQSGYNQGMARSFPSGNVMVLNEGYHPPFPTTFNGVYTLSSGSSGFTTRTSYPTTIFQTSTMEWNGNFFVFGGNGINGTASGGSTSAVRYMTTALNSWTSGTSLPSATAVGVGRTQNNIFFMIGATAYKGTGTGAWSTTTATPGSATPAYLNSGVSYCFTGSTAYYSLNDGATWVDAGIANPLSPAGPGNVIGNEGNQTTYPIYMTWDTYTSSPKMYYFSGEGFTLTNCFGQENSSGDYSTATNVGVGLLNDQYIAIRNVGGQQYATIA
jgi:hypothetical protein